MSVVEVVALVEVVTLKVRVTKTLLCTALMIGIVGCVKVMEDC